MFKQRITLTGLIMVLVLPFAAAAQMGPPEHGTDRPGEDLRSFTASRWQECSSSCASQKECWAYTFVAGSGGGTCWLKDEVAPARPYNGAVSGVKVMGSIERGFDRPGMDLRSGIPSDDPPACLRACQGESHCQAWTWVKPKGKGKGACWLKGNSPAAVKNDCCFSGIRVAAVSRNAHRSVIPRLEAPTASSGKIADPSAAVMFNPQPEPPDPTAIEPRTKSSRDGAPRLKSSTYSGQTDLDGGLDGQKRTESTVVLPGQDRSSVDDLDVEEEGLQVRPSDIGISLHKLPVVTGVANPGPQAQTATPKSATLPRRAPILSHLSPTPRGELLASIAAMSGGQELLDSVGITSPSPMDTQSDLQAALHTPMLKPDTPLDQLLQGGVTLYASGKIEPAGFDPKEPPLFYETMHGWGHSLDAPPNDQRLPIRSLGAKSDGSLMLSLGILRAPLDSAVRTYSLEIDFRGLGEFSSTIRLGGFWLYAAPVDWKLTSKGTYVAFLQWSGDKEEYGGWFIDTVWITFNRRQKEGFDREFRWLHITML